MILGGMLRGRSGGRGLALALSALILALWSAPSALAAALAARVNPSPAHVGSTYQIQISGIFKRRHAYLIAFIQYSSKRCLQSASKELARTHDTGGAYAAGSVRRTPFVQTTTFRARSRSTRRVCAYLFAKRVKPGARVKPLARASVVYQVV